MYTVQEKQEKYTHKSRKKKKKKKNQKKAIDRRDKGGIPRRRWRMKDMRRH
jgi:hypothetical protein